MSRTMQQQPWPQRVPFNDNNEPTVHLPPPMSIRGHQRSRTAVDLPQLYTRSNSSSPTRSSVFSTLRVPSRSSSPGKASTYADSEQSERPSLNKSRSGAVSKLASWFEGSSEPVTISLVPSPRKEKDGPFYQVKESEDHTTISQDNLTAKLSRRSTMSPSTANSSRFSFFRRTAPATTKPDPDELVQMDIQEALAPEPAEEATSSSYTALYQNAETLLKKFQLSYAENLGSLRQVTSARNMQADELDAAQTRTEHLKMQLLEMAEKAAEQERAIFALKGELLKHQQSIRIISDTESEGRRSSQRRGRRSDASSVQSFSDSDGSSVISVFSEVESLASPTASAAPSPVMKNARLYNPTLRLGANTAMSRNASILDSHCPNCHGVPASEAWDVIGIMKMESAQLKERVAELENAQDSALDFLSALKMRYE